MLIGGMLGILDSLTGGEVLIILAFALLILGPERLPDTARTMGSWVAKLRSMTSNLQSEVREVLDDPAMKPIREVGEFVAAPRKKLIEYATTAESEADAAKQVAAEAAAAAEEAEAAAEAARAKAEEAAREAEEAEDLADAAEHALSEAEADDALPVDPDGPEGPLREPSIWADLPDDRPRGGAISS